MGLKKRVVIIGAVLSGIAICVYFKNKHKLKCKLDTSITNGDKITATSLSDAENKTSVQTTPVNIEEAKSLGFKIASLISEKSQLTNRWQINKKQDEIDVCVQKLFEMGYKALPNGSIEKNIN
jgi:ribosomal protein L18